MTPISGGAGSRAGAGWVIAADEAAAEMDAMGPWGARPQGGWDSLVYIQPAPPPHDHRSPQHRQKRSSPPAAAAAGGPGLPWREGDAAGECTYGDKAEGVPHGLSGYQTTM